MEVVMDRKLHLLDSFPTHGSDGKAYKVCAYEYLVKDESLPTDGQEHWEPTGLLEYRLVDGDRLETAADGAWRVPASGIELRREA
jgi:hypothetical protein